MVMYPQRKETKTRLQIYKFRTWPKKPSIKRYKHARFIGSGRPIPNHHGRRPHDESPNRTAQANGRTTLIAVHVLQEPEHQDPDWVDEEQYDADGVGHAIGLPEGLPEASWHPDVLLKQVAPDGEAYEDADKVVPEVVCEEAGGDHREKNQRARQL